MSDFFNDHKDPDVALAALLLDVRTDVKVLLERSNVALKATSDHEKRIRSLERFRYGWPSLALVGTLLAGLTAGGVIH